MNPLELGNPLAYGLPRSEPEIKSEHALKNTGEGVTAGFGDSDPSVWSALQQATGMGSWGSECQERATLTWLEKAKTVDKVCPGVISPVLRQHLCRYWLSPLRSP